MKRTKVVDALQCTDFGKEITVKGWVRTHPPHWKKKKVLEN